MKCNILLLGQTGVGKSSLLNYIAGKELAEAGISSHLGGITRGINKYTVEINGQMCEVSDSEGLELAHSEYWQKLLNKELFNDTAKTAVSEWYHIVIFCIGANGGRVQDFELEILDRIVDSGYGTIIAFTKADLASEEELQSIITVIQDHFIFSSSIQYIPICSKKTRNNKLEGREELCNAIIDSWGESISNRLPSYLFDWAFDSLSQWYDSTYAWLHNQKIGLFNKSKSDVLEELNQRIQKKQGDLNKLIESKQKSAFKNVSSVYKAISQIIDVESFSAYNSNITPKLQKLQDNFVFEDHSVRKSLLTAASTALLFSVPIVGVPLTVLNTILHFKDNERCLEELTDAFNYQYLTLIKLYAERKTFMEYLLAEQIGYIYARCELAICYLKGRGVEENFKTFHDYLEPLADYIENCDTGYRNGKVEYYLAYLYYSINQEKEARKWLKMAKEDGYQNARSVKSFAAMKDVEAREDEAYEASFYDLDS